MRELCHIHCLLYYPEMKAHFIANHSREVTVNLIVRSSKEWVGLHPRYEGVGVGRPASLAPTRCNAALIQLGAHSICSQFLASLDGFL